MFDLQKIDAQIAAGYISKRKHPIEDYYIYNYTPQCQWEWYWTEETLACRGLILDGKGNIIARPFKKFFTLEQYEDLEATPANLSIFDMFGVELDDVKAGKVKLKSITDKVDGSLGILYSIGESNFIASRGSFASEQAIEGTAILHEKYGKFKPISGYTYLFEIVYPGNRIVVNYGSERELYFLTIIDNQTGLDKTWAEVHGNDPCPFPAVTSFDLSEITAENFESFDTGNAEGYVFLYENGFRIKMKFSEYKRLHKILTGASEREVWWRLRNGDPLTDLIDRVPDEFHTWLKIIVDKLTKQYEEIEQHAHNVIQQDIVERDPPLTRKQLAEKYQQYKYKSIMFAMLDNKQYKETIWRMIRPEANKPFAQEALEE